MSKLEKFYEYVYNKTIKTPTRNFLQCDNFRWRQFVHLHLCL